MDPVAVEILLQVLPPEMVVKIEEHLMIEYASMHATAMSPVFRQIREYIYCDNCTDDWCPYQETPHFYSCQHGYVDYESRVSIAVGLDTNLAGIVCFNRHVGSRERYRVYKIHGGFNEYNSDLDTWCVSHDWVGCYICRLKLYHKRHFDNWD